MVDLREELWALEISEDFPTGDAAVYIRLLEELRLYRRPITGGSSSETSEFSIRDHHVALLADTGLVLFGDPMANIHSYFKTVITYFGWPSKKAMYNIEYTRDFGCDWFSNYTG